MYLTKIRRALVASAVLLTPAAVAPVDAAGLTASGLQIQDPDNVCASWEWQGTASAPILICHGTVTPPPPDAPTGCNTPTLSTNPTTLTSAGGTATLGIAGCTASGTVTYQWFKNGSSSSFSTAQSPNDTLAANTSTTTPKTTSYQVKACNGASCTNLLPASPLQAVVPVASGGGGGGGGGGGTIDCGPGYSSTIVLNFPYVPGTGQAIQTTQGMSTSDILVAVFTPTTNGGTGNVQIADNAQASAGFRGSFSTTPCTFDSNVQTGLLTARWNFNGALVAGTKYYLNITGDSPLSVKLTAK